MKKLLIVLMALIFVAGFYATSDAGITGSKHDFSTETWAPSTNKKCEVCHTPHNAGEATSGPLWNHDITTASHTPYADPDGTMDATVGAPGGVSKLCLSCHDGTVALDSYGGATGTNFISGAANVGTDLSDDHPISFTYDSALATADGELATPSGGKVGTLPLFGAAPDQLECASCHDAHNTGAGSKLLIVSNTNSELCLTCHTK